MRIGVFGGTFDPVHIGHLIIAEQCREQAALDEVWFVPSARPPHKSRTDLTPFEKRVEMLTLAVAGQPSFRIEPLEADRPGPSYTADTLTELHRRRPDADLHLILGSDCLPDLSSWHDPIRVVTQATLLIVARTGWPVWPVEKMRASLGMADDAPIRQQIMSIPLVDISSRDLRRRVNEGRSIRYFVSSAVAAYVADKGLYR
jgi:nicotinate-nucleotide adenylyltransferase